MIPAILIIALVVIVVVFISGVVLGKRVDDAMEDMDYRLYDAAEDACRRKK